MSSGCLVCDMKWPYVDLATLYNVQTNEQSAKVRPYVAEYAPDRLYQRRAHIDPLFAVGATDCGAGDGRARRRIRRGLWVDPRAGDRHVRALRRVFAAAGLDRAAGRPSGADDGVLSRDRPDDGDGRVCGITGGAGGD